MKLYIRGKFTKPDGNAIDATDDTASVNNFLHSLFSQCTITLNGVNITQRVTSTTTVLILKRC
jgi:hypothetical protein